MARVGILGGTFNPPHIGHGVCAQEAVIQLGLHRLVLVPAARPPHKAIDDPGPEHRLAMCVAAAAAGDGGAIEASRRELDRSGPSYAVDTLSELHETRPEDELTFVMGADMAVTLPAWHEPERLLALAGLAVADRGGTERDDVLETLGSLAGARDRVRFFAMPRIDISSTFVRRRAAAGQPIRHLVPDGVATYIERHRLYAGDPSGAPVAA